jgi:glycosyltransferase involved in cell wall biosynthesis
LRSNHLSRRAKLTINIYSTVNGMRKLEHGVDVSTTTTTPLISVVMPVHNAAPYLDESIQSILGQTFKDFELVILDDASTDGSTEALGEWAKKDARIRLHRSEQNLGLSGSSNLVVSLARAPVIARMDADDISSFERLERQWEVMESLPDVALVGTLSDGIDAAGRRVRPRDRWRLVRRSAFPPFPHGAVMFRRAVFDEVGGYKEELSGGEDQDLFLRIARAKRVVVLPDVLYHYRYHVSCSSLVFLTAWAEGGSNGTRRRAEKVARLAESNGKTDARVTELRALRSAGSMRLWAGQRPEALRLPPTNDAPRWSAETILTRTWIGWARYSPASLKACMRFFIRTRDLLASSRLRDGRVCEWRFE